MADSSKRRQKRERKPVREIAERKRARKKRQKQHSHQKRDTIRDRILAVLKKRGLSINAFSLRVEPGAVHPKTVRAWLYKQRASVKLDTIEEILRVLEIDLGI